jgi:hypothetical protein
VSEPRIPQGRLSYEDLHLLEEACRLEQKAADGLPGVGRWAHTLALIAEVHALRAVEAETRFVLTGTMKCVSW